MNVYKAMKDQHKEEINNFPMFFAFSNSQFEECMNKLGLNSTDTDQILSLGGGGYLLKKDRPTFREMFNNHKE